MTSKRSSLKTRLQPEAEMAQARKKIEVLERQAQIEAALERVRASSLAMHRSEELKSVVTVLFDKLRELNLSMDAANINIWKKDTKDFEMWVANAEFTYPTSFEFLHFDHVINNETYAARENGEESFVKVYPYETKNEYFNYLFENTVFRQMPPERKKLILDAEGWGIAYAYSKHTGISLFNYSIEKHSEEEVRILKRFAKVFEQSYTRFLDLQKAEAQAREAQIEAALERVRSKSLAMHRSDELKNVVAELFERFRELNLPMDTALINILKKDSMAVEVWIANAEFTYPTPFELPVPDHEVNRDLLDARDRGDETFVKQYPAEVKNSYFKFLFENTVFGQMPDERKKMIMESNSWSVVNVFIKNAIISVHSYSGQLPSNEEVKIITRFARVFEQSYTRFLDLQRAEAQVREAQIEAALERVRAASMAMHKSDELKDVALTVLSQIEFLGIPVLGGGITISDHDKGTYVSYFVDTSLQSGKLIVQTQELVSNDFWLSRELGNHTRRGETEITLKADENRIREWIEFVRENHSAERAAKIERANFKEVYFHLVQYHPSASIITSSLAELPEDSWSVMRRLAKNFTMSYQRFEDLKKAEAQAREAQIEAALEHVRAEIASMRTAADLQRITPLIWRELTALGVPFSRCGVFIIDEATEQAYVYLSTPAGEAVAALHLKFDSAPVIEAAVQHWQQQQVYREEWNREQFIAWTQSILKQGLIDSPEKYQGGGEAPEKLVLHFMPFTQGMLYIGSSAALSDDEIMLSQSIAKAFGMAYARYEDFQRLEAAKAQVEAALENLQKTQQQLVTQEKLASLGQLTAGIAHEIKNPLNFVNNFAALSVDLAKELREEIVKRKTKNVNGDEFENMEEIIAMLEQNAEKINHHGQRADSIVKSMMQHARGSSGQRELADINHLLDEAVNLVYHGMRANDPSFNVTIEKEFDESIGQLEVVPQDISRVFLNMVNNACYAAVQKQKVSSGDGFSPTIAVTTKNLRDGIEIRILDNGNGISQDIREKIFNPFFTTKPTGQGTGLGLSISYDIVVQEHKGEIRVETEDGKFTEFVVRLPKNSYMEIATPEA